MAESSELQTYPFPMPTTRIASFTLIAAALLACAGCSHALKVPLSGVLDNTPPPARDAVMKRLAATTPNARAWADLPFNDALPDAPRAFTLDASSPVAEIDGQPTHFLAFVLPTYAQPYRVVFQTQPSARHLGNSFLLAPTVTLLDAEHKPIASTDVTLCVYLNWRPSMSGGFGAVKIDTANARYLVVTTSKKQLAATTYWAQSPTSFSSVNTPSGAALASIKPDTPATSGSFNVAHGPEGTLHLGRITPPYAKAVDDGLCGKPATAPGLLPELRKTLRLY